MTGSHERYRTLTGSHERHSTLTGFYEKDRATLLAELDSDTTSGLRLDDISRRQQAHGLNQFEEQKGESIGRKILHNLRDAATLILLFAAVMSLLMGIYHNEGYIEFVVITAIIILNITLAVTQERSAEKSLAALRNLNSPTSLVVRDGMQQLIDSVSLVPGDILLLKAGDLVSADARLLESVDLAVDESSLTGESLPAEKDAEAQLGGKVVVADQINMVFSGCLVTAGRGRALVVATGMNTQMGHIAGYLNNTQKLKTPLQIRINTIGKIISLIAVIAALTMFVVGFLRGAELWDMVFVAISLAVAAVPETLSLIVTLTLSHGVTEMVKKHALIRKLPAVETLGSTSVICTDKTGTLTQNRMTIKRLWIEGFEPFDAEKEFTALQIALLNKFALVVNAVAEIQPDGELTVIGAPTEAAVIRLFHDKGGDKSALEMTYPRVAEIPFSSERKMSTTVHQDPSGGYLVLTCGAFDRVPFDGVPAGAPDGASDGTLLADGAPGKSNLPLERTGQRNAVHDAFAHDSFRILALGSKHIEALPDKDGLGALESDLYFEGLIGIIDPPREEVAGAIAIAKNAGIRTVMITGDHAATAAAIACQIGLMTEGDRVLTGLELEDMSDEDLVENVALYSVYARVSPEDKIRIVEAWQEHDAVVAMTGDGVNDAPALKAADVGVAMGIAGTEVARNAADMILTDDNFSTIVEAVHKGRDAFSNIRKTVYFLLVCNFSEIIIMLGAMLIGWNIPLTPIMLLLINVLGDGIPGMALAREKSDPRIMQRNPIGRRESLFSGIQFVITKQIIAFVAVAWIAYYVGAFVDLSSSYASYAPAHIVGQTMTFLVVGWTSILHIFTVRSRQSIFKRSLKDNPRLVISALAMIVIFAVLVLVPSVAGIFGMVPISLYHWLIVIGLSLIPTITAELGKLVQNSYEARLYKNRIVHHSYDV